MNIHEVIRNRRSVRKYESTPIEPGVLRRMRDALRLAPSACNFQPWKFIWVQDGDLRRRVAEAANNQEWMADAPCIVVGCGRADDAYKKMGGDGSSIDVDLAIALDHLTLAAAAEGLGTCWIGAFNQAAVKELLSVPLDVKVVALTPLGRPAAPEGLRPVEPSRRKAEDEVFAVDRYDGPCPGECGASET